MRKRPYVKPNPTILLTLAMLMVTSIMLWAIGGCSAISTPGSSSASGSQSASSAPLGQNAYQAIPLPTEMRAMWITYLEWADRDISTEALFRQHTAKMFDECKDLGLNTLLVHVRAFSDAMYASDVYPWSHLITGKQGQNPGFDPLEIMVEEAHARGLRLEAWVNPYRIQTAKQIPPMGGFASNNPAEEHPEWVRDVDGRWFDPGIPEVQDMVVRGTLEIVQKYQVDGIHFDDYFYPGTADASFDAGTYATHGGGLSLEDWRRENVSSVVQRIYSGIKEVNPSVSFGISPQGNNDNNYSMQYSDCKLWMSTTGYIDYMMPQLYWGFNHRVPNGSDRFAFGNISNEWANYPRDESVKLYAGLASYQIGENGNGAGDPEEWSSGKIMSDMVSHLRGVNGFSGFALFRHDYFFREGALFAQEQEAIKALLQ